ncbi:MAG: sugar ABC transporter permease [Clostridia bacterium]|nr:sugar ABC transporter permease [Clostridia bacterium]
MKSVKNGMGERRKKRLIFYWTLMIWPIVWWLVFYLYLNFTNIVRSFQVYDGTKYVFNGLNNYVNVIKGVLHEEVLTYAFKNSIIVYFTGFIAGLAIGQIFSFYVYKQLRASKFFRTILFLPSIVPGIAFILCFKYITDRVIPQVSMMYFNKPMEGLLSSSNTAFGTLVFYFFWQGYTGSTIIYSNAMKNNVDPSVVEAALLDGTTALQEYFYITLPLIFPTLQIFLISDIGAILTNQLNVYSFFGDSADPKTYMMGYYIFKENLKATSSTVPFLAALNILVGLVPLPIIFLLKKITDKKIEGMF